MSKTGPADEPWNRRLADLFADEYNKQPKDEPRKDEQWAQVLARIDKAEKEALVTKAILQGQTKNKL